MKYAKKYQSKLKQLLAPSASENTVLVAILSLLLFMASGSVVLQNTGNEAVLALRAEEVETWLRSVSDNRIAAGTVTVLFWSFVGLVVYAIFWLVYVSMSDMQRDIAISERFLLPSSIQKSDYWISAMSRRIVVITGFLCIGFFLIILIKTLPYVFESTQILFLGGLSELEANLPRTVLAFAGWIVGVHSMVIVRRVAIQLNT